LILYSFTPNGGRIDDYFALDNKPVSINIDYCHCGGPFVLYLIRQYKLPRLVFDDVWKQNDEVTLMGMMYVLKVKQVKGNDKPES
jgi:hypothetical protein